MAGNTQTQTDDAPTTNDDAAQAAERLEAVADDLEALAGDDVADADTESLARLRQAVKAVEDSAEDARKDTVESELETRVDVGDSVDVGDGSTLSRVEGHRKYVPNEDGALLALEAAGVDARDVMKVKANKVAKAAEEAGLDVSVLVGESPYTYFR